MGRVAKLNPKVCDLSLALEEFLLAKQADGLAQRTLDDYRYHVGKFLETCQNATTYEAIRKAVIRYFSQPCSPGYRNIKLRNLKGFFNWCVAQGYLPANPVAGIRPAKEDLNRIRHVPLEALKKLLQQPDKRSYAGLRDYCLLLVQIDTGARPGELFQVRPTELNLEACELYIRPEVAKTRVGRTLVLSPFTLQALLRFLKVRPAWWSDDVPLFATETGKALDRSHWAARVREYCQQAGVKVTPYGLRHSFAIEFLKEANDPFALQKDTGPPGLSHDQALCEVPPGRYPGGTRKGQPRAEAGPAREKGIKESERQCVKKEGGGMGKPILNQLEWAAVAAGTPEVFVNVYNCRALRGTQGS